ncbi:MAG: shikimate dehydrogenase (NADP+) [Acidimicrobiia bacterium]|nr:shikimate dehydrogenase (NADP+) [Acidimicrobiia bacterium]
MTVRPVRLALLGHPLGHSRSPRIHRAALAACGIAGEYEPRDVDAGGFAAACGDIAAGRLDGANVTMPYKLEAQRRCDHLDADAARAGAVNTLARGDGGLAGWNTDVVALREALASLPDLPVLVLGAGGAAAAALVAAAGRRQIVVARRVEAARRLADRVGTGATTGVWGAAATEAVVVNATPLGMHGETLPGAVLEGAGGLIDLAYGPAETPAISLARSQGTPAVDGVSILVAQAAASFAIWTGLAAPREVMEAAARSGESLKAP